MKVKGPKHNGWNTFYEFAWDARRKLMKEIIDSGESDPLRVINRFDTLVKFSEQKVELDDDGEVTSIAYDLNSNRPEVDISNFSKDGVNIMTNIECSRLPHGLPVGKQLPFFDKKSETSYYTETDVNTFIADYIAGKEFDAIIELGSGFCQNLIRLFYHGIPKVPMFGLEYTNSGVQCGNMLAQLRDDMELQSLNFDYNAPDFSEISGRFKNVFVFSRHSIEQVQTIPEDLFEKIGAIADKVTGMHFEPFGFQYQLNGEVSEVDAVQRDFFFSKQWNENFVKVIVDQFLNEKIDITYLSKNIFGGEHVGNATSFALWHSK